MSERFSSVFSKYNSTSCDDLFFDLLLTTIMTQSLSGKLPEDINDRSLTATALGYYFPKDCFCLILAYNGYWAEREEYKFGQDTKMYNAYPILMNEMCINNRLQRVSNDLQYNACSDDIHVISSKKYCILNWDKTSAIEEPDILIKDRNCLAGIKKYLYLKYQHMETENNALITTNKVCATYIFVFCN